MALLKTGRESYPKKQPIGLKSCLVFEPVRDGSHVTFLSMYFSSCSTACEQAEPVAV